MLGQHFALLIGNVAIATGDTAMINGKCNICGSEMVPAKPGSLITRCPACPPSVEDGYLSKEETGSAFSIHIIASRENSEYKPWWRTFPNGLNSWDPFDESLAFLEKAVDTESEYDVKITITVEKHEIKG